MHNKDEGISETAYSKSLDDCEDDKIIIETISSRCRDKLNLLLDRQKERKKSLCGIRSMILRL